MPRKTLYLTRTPGGTMSCTQKTVLKGDLPGRWDFIRFWDAPYKHGRIEWAN